MLLRLGFIKLHIVVQNMTSVVDPQLNKMKPLQNAVLKGRGVNSGHSKKAIGIVLFLL